MNFKLLGYALIFILIAVVSYGGWVIVKKWNYAWGYESMVKNTVCQMVKPEHLKEPCDS